MKRKRLAVVGVFALVGVIAVVCLKRPSTRLEQTKAALRARGEKLSAAEFLPNPERPTATLDALTNLVKQLQVTVIHPSALTPMEMLSTGKARCAWRADDVAGYTWQNFDAQFANARQTLSEIRAAFAARPRHLGWDYREWAAEPRGHLVQRRTAVQWVAGAAVNDLHHGRFTNALENLHTLIDAANTYDQHWTFVSQMIRISIVDLGLRTTWEALQADQWSEDRLLNLQRNWEATPIFSAFSPTFEGERVAVLGLFEQARRPHTNAILHSVGLGTAQSTNIAQAMGSKLYDSAWRNLLSESDEMKYLEWSQSHLEAIRRVNLSKSWQPLRESLNVTTRQRNRLADVLHGLQFPLAEAARPSTSLGLRFAAQTETFRQMVVAAIAIKRFELSNHRPPESLASLVPRFLAHLPIDYMDGKPLRYRVGPDASWILYSVGQDGVDDAGVMATADPSSNSNTNSINFWSTTDVLWPRPEPAESNRPVSHPR